MEIHALIAANQQRWNTATYNPHSLALAHDVAARLVATNAKTTYEAIENATTVPWFVIAVIHEREASQSWLANLAQGDPWNKVSVHEPAGRGPFKSFTAAAVDALVNCAPHAAKWKDWSAGGTLSILELYNGEGYEDFHHMASPYLWAGSSAYVKGKYVADRHFDPNAVDHQLGCAVMLKAMMLIDSSIKFGGVV